MVDDRKLIGIEIIELNKLFSHQKARLDYIFEDISKRKVSENIRDHIDMTSKLFDEASICLNKFKQDILTENSNYYNLSDLKKTIDSLTKLIDSIFPKHDYDESYDSYNSYNSYDESRVEYNIDDQVLKEIELILIGFIRLFDHVSSNVSNIVDKNPNENPNALLKNLMNRLEELCANKINESLPINEKNLKEITEKAIKESSDSLEQLYDSANKKTSDILVKLQQEISDLQASTKQSIIEQIEQIKTNLANSKSELMGLVGDLEAYKSIVNHETEKEISKHYAEKARSEMRTYWVATILSIVIIVVSICLAWSGLNSYFETYVQETDPEKLKALAQTARYAEIYLGFRLILSFLLFSTVIYTSRIAYRAYIHWRHSESMKLKLSSLRPFINQLEPDDRKQIHKDLVPDYFGKDAGMIDVAGEKFKDFPTNVSAVVMKAMDHANSALGNSKKEENTKEDKNADDKEKKEVNLPG